MTAAIVTIQANTASQNDCCDIVIYGHQHPDDLVNLRDQTENAGFTQRHCCPQNGASGVFWTLDCRKGELMDDQHCMMLVKAIESAGMRVSH